MGMELLGSSGCHLCHEARQMVEDALVDFRGLVSFCEIDIADDSELLATYGTRIPVLRYRESMLFWPFEPSEISNLLLHDPINAKNPEEAV